MTILFKDTFSDVDGTALTAHTPDIATNGLVWKMFGTAVAKITGNQAYFTTPNSYNPAHVELNLQNFAVQAKFATVINLSAIMLRYGVDSGNWLGVMKEPESGRITLKKRVAGTFTILWDSGTLAIVAGDTVRAEHEGTTIRVYINGVLKATVTNVTEHLGTMQRVGFASPDATPSAARWDDFQIEDLSTGTPTGTPGSANYATKQSIYQSGSAALATRQQISQAGQLLAATRQSIYQVGSIAYATQQNITDGGIPGAISYATKQVISRAASVNVATKQAIYRTGASEWATLQQILDFVTVVGKVNLQGALLTSISLAAQRDMSISLQGSTNPPSVALEGEL